jgi:ABC-type sugar transport system ATPase subunit
MAKIELQNIAHSYNPQSAEQNYALNPFNMTWEDGGRYAILGPIRLWQNNNAEYYVGHRSAF